MADANTLMLMRVADALGELTEHVVFIGGCATALLITDRAAAPVRATVDVDAIARIETLGEYHRLGDALRSRGFRQTLADGQPPYRWALDDLVFDLMPVDEAILGFSNRWYGLAVDTATWLDPGNGRHLRLVSAPCLVATKLEAFHGRGRGDYLASHDLEDVLTVVDGRPELLDEMAGADAGLRRFVEQSLAALLADRGFLNVLPGLVIDDGSSARWRVLLERLRALAGS